jgi:hypothetical protein
MTTEMHGPTCIFWANLTPFSLQRRRLAAWLVDNPACEVCTGLGRILAVCDRASTA